jgi:hypothetical protein
VLGVWFETQSLQKPLRCLSGSTSEASAQETQDETVAEGKTRTPTSNYVTFTKLFSSIIASSVWCEDNETRIVWITMMAMCNKNGYVFASEPGLAKCAQVPLESVLKALKRFQSPDKFSCSPEYEGRRIEKVDGGWRLLNYLKFRAIRNEDDRREYHRIYMRKRRELGVKNVKECQPSLTAVNRSKPPSTQAEAEAEAEKNKIKTLAHSQKARMSEMVYQLYPRKIGKKQALKAIEKAITDLMTAENYSLERAVACLKERTRSFAESPAGQRGSYTPHPATWFNRGSYRDDPKEWQVQDRTEAKHAKSEEAKTRVYKELFGTDDEDSGGDLPKF